MVNTVAMLAGLYRLARGGGGGCYLTSQLGSSLYGGVTRFAEVLAGRKPSGPLGSASPFVVPDQAFATADGYVAVSAPTERCWQRLCVALGRPDLQQDPRFADNAARVAAREALVPLLAELFATGTNAEWCERLVAADVPCAPVPRGMTLLQAMESHPQVRELNLLRRIPSHYGTLASQAPHWRFADTPASIECGPPLQGEHTALVLANLDSKDGLIAALAGSRRQTLAAMEAA